MSLSPKASIAALRRRAVRHKPLRTMPGPDLFQYDNILAYLRDRWIAKKARNPAFSLRSWAKLLGFKNNTTLSLMLGGKRPIPRKYLPLLMNSLDLLDEGERLYFETLFDLAHAKGHEERALYGERLGKLRKQRRRPRGHELRSEDLDRHLADPLAMILLECAGLASCPQESELQKGLRIEAALDRVRDLLAILQKKGLIALRDGKMRRTHMQLFTKADVAHTVVRQYHNNCLDLAKKALEFSVEEREYCSFAIAWPADGMANAKQELRQLIQDFIARNELTDSAPAVIHQMNVQLFPVTKVLGAEGGKK